MYLCIPKKPELMAGLLYHSYNNYKTCINVNDYNFCITDFNNQVFLFYIINVEIELNNENKDIKFFIFTDTKIILDDFYKLTLDTEEFNMIKCITPWYCDTNHLIFTFNNNTLKIYYDKKRLFMGPIKHFYPDGLCKEYVLDNIKFIRTYKMGIACGNGTEYISIEHNKIIYNGYFENFKYNGEGTYYYKSGHLQYKGEFRNGFIFKGIEYYDYNGGIKYEGEFLNNKYNGYGIQYFNGVLCNANIKGKKKYEGMFINGQYHGEGIKYNNKNGNIQYKGIFSNGKLNGQILEYNDEGILIYDGKYVNDYKHGSGTEYIDEQISFKGEFSNGMYHGIGSRYSKFGFSLGCYTYKNGVIV